ncbi:hypothetical protein QVD17_25123 [Tagetes erecta]|uniref:Uncharacterized protein n=1 Tax=Tagetes erecta TaxID=13708 RepID=A0AAD8NV52_TARER|nr:hypothetical protein QVD17_25123 [Tagetes erecta]
MYSSSDHRHVVVVKDGHRAVVVEYDYAADGTTKVFISPPVVPSAVNTKESSSDQKPSLQKKQSEGMVSGPDVICDAYNNCKRKIVDAFDKAHGIEKRTKEYVNEVIAEKVTKKGIIGKVKEVVKDCASKDFDIIDSRNESGKIYRET